MLGRRCSVGNDDDEDLFHIFGSTKNQISFILVLELTNVLIQKEQKTII